MDISKVKERIQALLNLANDPHTTPSEAATARAIANKLMAQYNLNERGSRPWIFCGNGRAEVNLEDIELLLKTIKGQEELIASLEREVEADMTVISLLEVLKNTIEGTKDLYKNKFEKSQEALQQNQKYWTQEIETVKTQSAIFVIVSIILVLMTIACSLLWPLHGGP